VRAVYSASPATESNGRCVRTGIATNDDFRWLRCWWESDLISIVPFAKGGGFARFYADLPLVILWHGDGRQLKVSKLERFRLGELTENNSKIWNQALYFRPGVTYSARSQAGFSARLLPEQSLFGHKGPVLFAPIDDPTVIASMCAVVNSTPFLALLALQTIFGSYEIGMLKVTPFPALDPSSQSVLASQARLCWSKRRSLDTAVEVSHAFIAPALLQVNGKSFGDCVRAWADRVAGTDEELENVQSEIDEFCFELYRISAEDRRAIVEGFGSRSNDDENADSGGNEDADDSGEVADLDPAGLAAGLVSWSIGVATGRFDLRLVTGERLWPGEPDPFDPLPACSPGMLTGDDRLPLTEPPLSYAVGVSAILVDDPGHRLDITARVRSVFDVVFGEDADAWWTDVGEVLGTKGGEVSGWLRKGFFDYHLKTYSKSRRKAPIMWPIGTRSGSYIIWLYAHNVSADSLYQALNDLLVPKLLAEEGGLTQLRQEAGTSPTAAQRKAIDAQERLLGELREFRELLEAVAPLWAPDLNDGIVLVLAPLWRLFAHHRAWSTELRKHWAKLAKGDYDWAQVAMHLWPERVFVKCGEDRSIAIAHGLEDVFWVGDPANEDKWIPRATPAIPVEELIAQHRSPAVSAALERMGKQ
jgi:hypothetical protein